MLLQRIVSFSVSLVDVRASIDLLESQLVPHCFVCRLLNRFICTRVGLVAGNSFWLVGVPVSTPCPLVFNANLIAIGVYATGRLRSP